MIVEEETKKTNPLIFAVIYYLLASISFGFVGFVVAGFNLAKDLDYTSNKIILLGFMGVLALSVWSASSIMIIKKLQESIKGNKLKN